MTGTTRATTGRRAGARHLLAFGGLCALLVVLAVAIAVPAGATNARVIGKTKHTPAPDCPKTPCNAIGSVTGFQLVADGKKRPFNVHKNGTIVAWAVDLARVTKRQRKFFGKFFETDKFHMSPTARLSVLKHKGKRKYKLLKRAHP